MVARGSALGSRIRLRRNQLEGMFNQDLQRERAEHVLKAFSVQNLEILQTERLIGSCTSKRHCRQQRQSLLPNSDFLRRQSLRGLDMEQLNSMFSSIEHL